MKAYCYVCVVFISDGVIFVIINYDQVKTRLLESHAETKELNLLPSIETSIVIGLSLNVPFQLRQSGFHQLVSAGVVRGVGRKWKRSDSSD